ncbi:MAG: hypothetical protein Q4E65_08590 [Clostridia bacterium]|nr:hypothetical protein [Clostridia bacterium]
MSYAKRALAGFLSLLLLCSFCMCFPQAARAEAPSDGQHAANSVAVNAGGDEVSSQEMFTSALEFLKAATDLKDLAIWAASTVFKILLPSDDPNAALLKKLSDKIDDQTRLINAKTSLISAQIIESSALQQINAYLEKDAAKTILSYKETLYDIDAALSDGHITPDVAATRRTALLVHDLPGAAPLGSLCDFDRLVVELGTLLTMGYATIIPSKPRANLFTLYDEWQKRTYKWENQGYEDRAAFQNWAVAQYATAAAIDKLSLTARIQKAREDGTEPLLLITRLRELETQVASVQKMAAAMKVVERPAKYRYYQIPGHEKLLLSIPMQSHVPAEARWAGTSVLNIHNSKGLAFNGNTNKFYLKPHFWEEYSCDADVTYEWLQSVYEDYGGKMTLDDIFFGPNEGNIFPLVPFPDPSPSPFPPLTGAAASDANSLYWYITIAPVGPGALQINSFHDPLVVYTNVVDRDCNLKDQTLMKYGPSSASPTTNLLCYRLVEEKEPVSSEPADNALTGADTQETYNVTPVAGESGDGQETGCFEVPNCDYEDFTGLKLAGKPLQRGVDFTVEKSETGVRIKLSDAVLASLGEGMHTLYIFFVNGQGRVEFRKPGVIAAASVMDVPATGGAPRRGMALMLLTAAWLGLCAACAAAPQRPRRQ